MTRVDSIQLPIFFNGASAARSFYQGGLGLTEVRSPELDRPGTLRFALGSQRLDLVEGRYSGGGAVPPHLALSVQDLSRLVERLRYAGHRVEALPGHPPRVTVEDPFGNRWALLEAPAAPLGLAAVRFAV